MHAQDYTRVRFKVVLCSRKKVTCNETPFTLRIFKNIKKKEGVNRSKVTVWKRRPFCRNHAFNFCHCHSAYSVHNPWPTIAGQYLRPSQSQPQPTLSLSIPNPQKNSLLFSPTPKRSLFLLSPKSYKPDQPYPTLSLTKTNKTHFLFLALDEE